MAHGQMTKEELEQVKIEDGVPGMLISVAVIRPPLMPPT